MLGCVWNTIEIATPGPRIDAKKWAPQAAAAIFTIAWRPVDVLQQRCIAASERDKRSARVLLRKDYDLQLLMYGNVHAVARRPACQMPLPCGSLVFNAGTQQFIAFRSKF